MSKLFISHSSHDDLAATALHDWLIAEGWGDLFLDVSPERGIVAGERWERALHDAANRCDAVLFLVSRHWLDSEWCQREFDLAHRLNKRIIGLTIEELEFDTLPDRLTRTWQLVDLAGGRDHQRLDVVHPRTGEEGFVYFSESGLKRLRSGLRRSGINPRYFEWPPANDTYRTPYRGLRPLEAKDAGIFFGREAPTIDLLARLRGLRERSAPRVLAILGASGAGKSSFLRAGLLPRLERDDRHFLPLPVVRPESAALNGERGLLSVLVECFQPMKRSRGAIREALDDPEQLAEWLLERCRHAAAGAVDPDSALPTLVLAIDQAEELFLQEGQEESLRLLELIEQLASRRDLPLIVLFTIRSDSYDALQSAPALAGIHQHTFSLGPMPTGAYAEVIQGPAKRLQGTDRALQVDPALTDALMSDLEQGGGHDALPLLAFTLERLFQEFGGDGRLTHDEYRQLGGIRGSIEAATEEVFKAAREQRDLPNDRKALEALARRALIPWLSGIDAKSLAPRRRVARWTEVPEEARPLVELMVEQRLLTTDCNDAGEITVEPAHEALLRQWGLLKGWLEEDVAALSALEAIQRATRDWLANGEAGDWLNHSAGRLEEAESVSQREDLRGFLANDELRYLHACRASYDARTKKELEDAKALATARAQAVRRTRIGLVAAAGLAVAAGVVGLQAYQQGEVARAERDRANETINLVRDNLEFMNYELTTSIRNYVPVSVSESLTDRMTALMERLESEGSGSGVDLDARATTLQRRAQSLIKIEGADIEQVLQIQRQAHGLFTELAARNPDRYEDQLKLSLSFRDLGRTYQTLGDFAEAEENFLSGLQIIQSLMDQAPTQLLIQRRRAELNDAIGLLMILQGDLDKAERAYTEAYEIRAALVSAEPGNDDYRRILAISHTRLSEVLSARGDLVGAADEVEKALEIRRQLAASDTANFRASFELADAHSELSVLRLQLGDLEAAEYHALESRQMASTQVARDPDNRDASTALMSALKRLGYVYLTRPDFEQARNVYTEYVELAADQAEQSPASIPVLREFAAAQFLLGQTLMRLEEFEAARDFLVAALEKSDEMLALDPTNTVLQSDRASFLSVLARVEYGEENLVGALDALEDEKQVLESLMDRSPGDLSVKYRLGTTYRDIADTQLELGDHSASRDSFLASKAIGNDLIAANPDNPQFQRFVEEVGERIKGL